MPNIKSAKKELRKSKKRSLKNKTVKENLKTILKKGRKSIEGKAGDAKDLLTQSIKALDKAAQKGIIKKNTAKRKKSRLQKKFNALNK